MTASVDKIVNKVRELELDWHKPDQCRNDAVKPIIDTLAVGVQKLKSLTLATFNRKAKTMMDSNGFEVKEDEILTIDFAASDEQEHTFDYTE